MLTLGISNLGPVRKATVAMEPLTVLVGPNNSGKSVLATAMYAALSATTGQGDYITPAWSFPLSSMPTPSDALAESQDEVLELLTRAEPPTVAELSPGLVAYIEQVLDYGLHVYGRAVLAALERGFGATASELRRKSSQSKSAQLVIEDDSLAWRVTISIGTKSSRVYTRSPNVAAAISRLDRPGWRRLRTRFAPTTMQRRVIQLLASEVVRGMFSGLRPTLYLPAARSGLMQGQRAIAGAIVRRASLAGIEDVRVPALSGVVADFLSRLITIQESRYSGFAGEADRLERQIMHGHLSIINSASGSPDIIFTTDEGSSFPIHRTSSMISELAPVVLMLRTWLDPGDTLIIEEPEAHLHPATQILLAQSVARLVNLNLQVVLTTHSEFFLQQLNNAILAAGAGPAVANRLGLKQERLPSDNVAAYLFEPSSDGTMVRRLEVRPDEGIPESGFSAVAEALYDQAVALDKAARNG